MRKKSMTRFTLLTVALFLLFVFGVFFINLDHLTSGKLSKVEVVVKDPVSGSQSVQKTFTDPQELKEQTSIFFGKINRNLFADTAEDSMLSVRFTFENKIVSFLLFYETANGQKRYTYFKYPQRKMKFMIPESQSDRLLDLLP